MFAKIAENKKIIQKTVCPVVALIFIIIASFVFIKTISFLSDNINKAFIINEVAIENGVLKLDMENYDLIRKKFNLPQFIEPTPATPSVEDTPPTAPQSSELKIEKSSLSIKILNGAGISGLAGQLKNRLTQAGYSVSEIGNSPSLENTTIQIKSSQKTNEELINEITQIVSERYVPQMGPDLTEEDAYDIIIMIGKN